jgi:hypothetical protein
MGELEIDLEHYERSFRLLLMEPIDHITCNNSYGHIPSVVVEWMLDNQDAEIYTEGERVKVRAVKEV